MAISTAADNAHAPPATSAHEAQLLLSVLPLHSQRAASASSNGSTSEAAMRRLRNLHERPSVHSSSSRNTQASASTRGENAAAPRAVKSLPRKITSSPLCGGRH